MTRGPAEVRAGALRRSWIAALVVLVTAACTDAGPAEPDGSMSLASRAYLDTALMVMELNSVRRHEIDWPSFRAETFADAAGAQTTFDTHAAIEDALGRIGDGHSFFRAPGPWGPGGEGEGPTASLLGDVGYLSVPAFSGGGPEGDALAGLYHAMIEDVDTAGATCRWVVDLRGNTGGNMWPMVAGVGPILGEGTVGHFVDPDSVRRPWVYGDGEARIDDDVITASPGYELEEPDPFVAVLTDSLTASSGEAVAVTFRGRDGARSFGTGTWGVSTANAAFPLRDGAVIFLTVSTMADRLGTVYGGSLSPDELVEGSRTGDPETDAALDAALGWLGAQSCA